MNRMNDNVSELVLTAFKIRGVFHNDWISSSKRQLAESQENSQRTIEEKEVELRKMKKSLQEYTVSTTDPVMTVCDGGLLNATKSRVHYHYPV